MDDELAHLCKYAYDHGIIVELRWGPGYSSVESSEMVDELAKRLRRCAQFIMHEEQLDLIVHHVSITPTSTELLRQDLLPYLTPNKKKDS